MNSGPAAAARALLRDLLAHYRPADATEAAMLEQMIRFVAEHEDCLSRSLGLGHVTGSAWILDSSGAYALLTHHRKLGRWLQPGGHVEDDADILASALREAREETGLVDVRPLSEGIFDVDIHRIPSRGAEAEHFHYDVRFLFEADRAAPLRVSSESRELAWVEVTKVAELNPEESMRRLVRKSQHRLAGRNDGP